MSNILIAGTDASGDPALPTASTIDPVNDYSPIYTNSATATQAINRNTYLGLASAPVGLTDSQTLTNKTLTSPTIAGATLSGTLSGTYTIGGTPTFPSSVVQLTSTQTLTNKTLTSPVINSPTITNAIISSDAITGYTAGTSGTIYGIAIASGQITQGGSISGSAIVANSIPSGVLETGSVSATNISTSAIFLGYAKITSSFSTSSLSAVSTGIAVTVTVPSGGRGVKITMGALYLEQATLNDYAFLTIIRGTIAGTVIGGVQLRASVATQTVPVQTIAYDTPAAGSTTYTIGLYNGSTGPATIGASATQPAYILVECV